MFLRLFIALMPLLAVPGSVLAHGLGFFSTSEQAVDYARKGGGIVLVFFTGSDWNERCHELDVRVWEDSDFAEYANSRAFALLNADFPQRTRLSKEQQEELRALAARHAVTQFPTIVALTPDLLELGRHEYRGEDAATITELLETWSEKNQAATATAPDASNQAPPAAAPIAAESGLHRTQRRRSLARSHLHRQRWQAAEAGRLSRSGLCLHLHIHPLPAPGVLPATGHEIQSHAGRPARRAAHIEKLATSLPLHRSEKRYP